MHESDTAAPMTSRPLLSLLCLLLPLYAEPLPKPKPNIPPMPPMQPSVVTAAGQRLLLGYVDVEVSYDEATRSVRTNRPGWWLSNFPLDRIKGLEGKPEKEIAELLFEAETLPRNWYLYTAGEAPPEPPEPVRPAPIELTPDPAIVVNQRHPGASDENPGTGERPFKTISAAIAKLEAGAIVHVHPGIYWEAFKVEKGGTADRPIWIEGVRGADGTMPVISGNDVFPFGSWVPVKDLPGVYRAPASGHLASEHREA